MSIESPVVSQLLRRRRVGLSDLPLPVVGRIARLALAAIPSPVERQRARAEMQLVSRAFRATRVGDDEFVVCGIEQLDALAASMGSGSGVNAERAKRCKALRLVGGWWGVSPHWRIVLGGLLEVMKGVERLEVRAGEQEILGRAAAAAGGGEGEGLWEALAGLTEVTEVRLEGKFGKVEVGAFDR